MQTIRPPAVAGMFYPANKEKLENDILLMLESIKSNQSVENIFALIVPHAGYIYSGKTAAYAYNLIKDKDISTVIIISPSHREYFPGVSIFSGDAYETPLGIIQINNTVREKLIYGSKIIFKGKEGHKQEHAVEVQLPFLQMLLKDFTVVPVVIGDQRKSILYELADHLKNVIDKNSLIIVSTDLSHFYTKEAANELDTKVEQRIKDFDYEGLQNDLETGKCEACGGGGIIAVMRTADLLNRKKSLVLKRSDSGDVSGDNNEVVGYLSAVIY